MGFSLSIQGFGQEELFLNAPHLIALQLAFLSLASILTVTLFSSAAVLRDVDYRMEEMIYSTPVTRSQFSAGEVQRALRSFSASFSGRS